MNLVHKPQFLFLAACHSEICVSNKLLEDTGIGHVICIKEEK